MEPHLGKNNTYIRHSIYLMSNFVVYFDVEATGLDVDCDEILQIGAVSPSGETFCSFIMPQVRYLVIWHIKNKFGLNLQVEINPGAAAVNKFSVNNGKLCRDGQSFTTVSMQRGIQVGMYPYS